MFIHNFDPVFIDLGFLSIRWYSLAYIFGIFLGVYWGKYLIKKNFSEANLSDQHLEDYVVWAVLGIIFGGRLGYVFFYDFSFYLSNLAEIPKVWNGGMSFHGGLIGIVISSFVFSKKNKISFWSLTDVLACISPIGIFLGRISNFINGELVGKPTDVSWSFIFPKYDQIARHPSQLYEALLEGLLLFFIMNTLVGRLSEKNGYLSIIFLMSYSFFRIIAEIFREPDQHLGYLYFGLSMGTLLSLLTIFFGSFFIIWKSKNDFRKN